MPLIGGELVEAGGAALVLGDAGAHVVQHTQAELRGGEPADRRADRRDRSGTVGADPVGGLVALVVLLMIQLLRISREEKIITGYPEYASQVRWRLVPNIF